MKISRITVKNFRLLKDVEIIPEDLLIFTSFAAILMSFEKQLIFGS